MRLANKWKFSTTFSTTYGDTDTSAENDTDAGRGNGRAEWGSNVDGKGKETNGQPVQVGKGESSSGHLDGAIYRWNGDRSAGIDKDH